MCSAIVCLLLTLYIAHTSAQSSVLEKMVVPNFDGSSPLINEWLNLMSAVPMPDCAGNRLNRDCYPQFVSFSLSSVRHCRAYFH